MSDDCGCNPDSTSRAKESKRDLLDSKTSHEGVKAINIDLIGSKNADVITGLGYSEELYGLDGNDYIRSGIGGNKIYTGDGKDTIIYTSEEQSKKGSRDTLVDFRGDRGDRIDLSSLSDSRFIYIGNDEFTGKRPEVRFKDGLLQININENRSADMEIELEGVNKFKSYYLTKGANDSFNLSTSSLASSPGVSTSVDITIPFVTQSGLPTDSTAVISGTTGPYLNSSVKAGNCPGSFPFEDCFSPSTWTASVGAGFAWETNISVSTGSDVPQSGEKFVLPITEYSPFSIGGGVVGVLYLRGGLKLDAELGFDESMRNKNFSIYSGQKLGFDAKFGPNFETNFTSSSGKPKATVDIDSNPGLDFKAEIIPSGSIEGGLGVGVSLDFVFGSCEFSATVASLKGRFNSGNNILFTYDEQSSEFAGFLSGEWNAFGLNVCGGSAAAKSGSLGEIDLSSFTINPIERI